MKRIAIIGGGPAGAMAAEKLARGSLPGGASVVVFEERVGWEKPCGGGLTTKALRRYPFLCGASAQLKFVRELELWAANGASVRVGLREPLAIYSRGVLNGLLLARAEDAGAAIIQDRVFDLQRAGSGWQLAGRRETYQADYVVVAAGARSRLRRGLAEDFTAQDFMLTLGYYVPGADGLVRVQFFENFEGYAWAFPRPDHRSIGICAKVGESRMAGLRERLHGFMRKFGYSAESATVYSHLLPCLTVESWSNLRLLGQGWALVGDAAGLVDPVTGEGIYYAMRSGELLAESLLAGEPQSYPERVREEFGRALARGAQLSPFIYRGNFFGDAVTTRLIQFGARSRRFRQLVQDLVEGSQSYPGLAARLCLTLVTSLGEMASVSLREAVRRARIAEI